MEKDRNGIKWNREETILALDLYCRTPFSKINQKNSEIVKLAQLIGRTAGSVALKMHNLAHYDPELQRRNIIAMAHGSKLDGEIFSEFSKDWENLSYQAQCIRARIQNKDVLDIIEFEENDELPIGKYREQMIKARVGQYFFRTTVLSIYNNSCCITGLKRQELLVASHIKPWSVCEESTERTNPANGLCLNALYDKAFDKGLITLNKKYQVVISAKLKDSDMDKATKTWLMGYAGHPISLPDKFLPGKQFIEYHNDMIFQK